MKLLLGATGAIEIISHWAIKGMTDKDGNPVHAIRFEENGPVYMDPDWYAKLRAEVASGGGDEHE